MNPYKICFTTIFGYDKAIIIYANNMAEARYIAYAQINDIEFVNFIYYI